MRKKFLVTMLVGAMTISMIGGCSKKDGKADPTEAPTTQATITEAPTTEVAPTDAAVTEAPTTEAAPTQGADVDVEPTDEPEEETAIGKLEAAGTTDGETYTNSVIGFSITYPEGWKIFSSDETYKFIAVNAGMTEDYAETLKSQTQMQGVSYLTYGSDTQLNEIGTANNLMAQGMTGAVFESMGDDKLLSFMSDTLVKQYTDKGGTCDIKPTQTIKIDDQDVYTISADITIPGTTGDMVAIKQEYIAFRRNKTFVFMSLSSAPNDMEDMRQHMLDNMSFQDFTLLN